MECSFAIAILERLACSQTVASTYTESRRLIATSIDVGGGHCGGLGMFDRLGMEVAACDELGHRQELSCETEANADRDLGELPRDDAIVASNSGHNTGVLLMQSRSEHTLRSWMDLARLAEKLSGEDWIFRGESSPRHALRPGSGRVGREMGATRRARFTEADERAALHRFKNDALPYLTFRPASDRDLEWLAIAQHHGMQTRLLDWTESLFIAAFFAVEQAGSDGPGIIYGLKGLPVIEGDADPFAVRTVSVYRPSHLTSRIAPQWGVFTVHPRPTEDFRKSPDLQVWRLPTRTCCRQVKRVLDSCGINYASIYPDLTGLARHIYWRYKWGLSQTKPPPTPNRRRKRESGRR